MDSKIKTEMVQVLCGCGWGSLSMPIEDVPATCPVCGQPIGEEPGEGEE